MKIQNSTKEFMALYQSIYQNLHSTWAKGERNPSSESIAIINHLILSGPLTVTEAARHFDRAQSAMSELIDRMQANGYVDRIKDSRDKRRTLVWLTKSGRDLFDRTQEVLDRKLLEESMQKLSEDEREKLITSLRSIVLASQVILSTRRKDNGK